MENPARKNRRAKKQITCAGAGTATKGELIEGSPIGSSRTPKRVELSTRVAYPERYAANPRTGDALCPPIGGTRTRVAVRPNG